MLVAFLVIGCSGAWGATSGEPRYDIDIPSLDVAEALNRLAEQTDTVVLFPYDLAEGRQANEVVGRYTLTQAVEVLLRGTGIAGGLSDKRVLQISLAGTDEPDNTERHTEKAPMQESDNERKPLLRRIGATLAAVLAASSGFAADGASEADQDEDEALREELLVVTGTRLPTGPEASPITVITRPEIDARGLTSIEDIVRYLPQNFSTITNGGSYDGRSPRFQIGSVTINLRGLGEGSTLVLVNGRRLAASPSERGTFTDVSTLPFSAIERVEVMTDGASAVYGSDAVGGVVNFIMKDDYRAPSRRYVMKTAMPADTEESLSRPLESRGIRATSPHPSVIVMTTRYMRVMRDWTPTGTTASRAAGSTPTPSGNPAIS